LSTAPSVIPPVERSSAPPLRTRRTALRRQKPLAEAKSPPVAKLPPSATPSAPSPVAGVVSAVRHYLVQVGVFSNAGNAEELRAKLELAGLPTQVETRVLVGPFASQSEARRAREKLRALGMEQGVLISTKK
jgi:DedD protein